MKTKGWMIGLLVVTIGFAAAGQEENKKIFTTNGGVDLASMYLWRGFQLGNGAALQPWGEVTAKGITLGTWGSSELKGGFNEIDLYARYNLGTFSLQFTDLFFPGYEGLNQDYFDYGQHTTGHCAELGLGFNGTEKLPLSAYAGTILYGSAIDPKDTVTSDVNHSLYFELRYAGNLGSMPCSLFAGFTPGESMLYQTTGFRVFNAGATMQKNITLTSTFTLPVKISLATNPVIRKTYLALLISL